MQISDLASVVSNYLYGDSHSCEAALRAYTELCKRLGEDAEAIWAQKEIAGYSLNDSLPAYRKTHSVKVVSEEAKYCVFDERDIGYIDSLPVSLRRGEWESLAIQRYLPKIQGLTCIEDKLYVCLRNGLAYYENQVQNQCVVVLDDPTIRVAGDNTYSTKMFFTDIKVMCNSSVVVRMLSEIRNRLLLDFEGMQKRHNELYEDGTIMAKSNISINNCNQVQVAATAGVSCQHMVGESNNEGKPIKRGVAKTILEILAALGITVVVAWWIYVRVSISMTTEDDKKKSTLTIEGTIDAAKK